MQENDMIGTFLGCIFLVSLVLVLMFFCDIKTTIVKNIIKNKIFLHRKEKYIPDCIITELEMGYEILGEDKEKYPECLRIQKVLKNINLFFYVWQIATAVFLFYMYVKICEFVGI